MSTSLQTATKWDYKTVVLTHGFMGYHKDELDRPTFEKALDVLGQAGFELSWVFMNQKLHKEKDGHVLLFKRLLPVGHSPDTAESN